MTYKQTVKPNLNPIVIENGKPLLDWCGWCLATVEAAFGTARTGQTAWDEWTNYVHHKHQDRNWPKNVYFPIWFSGARGDGHVCFAFINSAGAMRIWTSPLRHIPYFINYSNVDALCKSYGIEYAGWSEDIGGVSVIEAIIDSTPAAPITPASTHPYTIEPINPKQVKLNKQPTWEWNLNDVSWDSFSKNPVSQQPKGTVVKVVAIAHHKLGGSYYMTDTGKPAGYNIVDASDYTPPAEPPKPAEPAKPANIEFTKLAAPKELVANKQPTHIWDLGFDVDANARSVGQLALGDKLTVYGRAQRTDHDRPAYFMTEADFGQADTTGIPAKNEGINTVDLSEPPAEPSPTISPADAPAAAAEDAGETISVTVNPPSWQSSFVANPEPVVYVAKQDVQVQDLAGKQPPQQLKKGTVVPVAGSFTKDGATYFRTPTSLMNEVWYGIPISALTRQRETLLGILAEAFGTFERALHIKK